MGILLVTINTDKRAQRTEHAIQAAFEHLIATMPLSEITVTRLTQEADINRKTFYLHYNSIEDLLDGQVDYISNQMLSILAIRPLKEIYSDPGFFFDQCSKLVLDHHSIARALSSSNECAPYMRKIDDNIAILHKTTVLARLCLSISLYCCHSISLITADAFSHCQTYCLYVFNVHDAKVLCVNNQLVMFALIGIIR